MKSLEYKLQTTDGQEVQIYEWLPDDEKNIKGIVQIIHGMAEHAKRYKHFAGFMAKNNYAIFACDLRGHGKTAGRIENLGFLGKKKGWQLVLDDLKKVSLLIAEKYPEKPFFLLGHSMGSFLAQQYITEPPFKLHGAIFSATGASPGPMGHLGVLLTKFLLLFYPANSQSKLIDKLTFGNYNKKIKPAKTKFDWLSRDEEQVQKYIDDPYCGNIFSLKGFQDLIKATLFVNRQSTFDKTPEDLPIYMMSGSKDPLGGYGKAVDKVYKNYKKAGVKDIVLKIYPEGRHEMLNEINREVVYSNILFWIQKQHF